MLVLAGLALGLAAWVDVALRGGDRAEAVRLVHEQRNVAPEAAERFAAELARRGT